MLELDSNNATSVLGSPDDIKLHSSMTLFAEILPGNLVFEKVLDKFFTGRKDEKTIRLLGID